MCAFSDKKVLSLGKDWVRMLNKIRKFMWAVPEWWPDKSLKNTGIIFSLTLVETGGGKKGRTSALRVSLNEKEP